MSAAEWIANARQKYSDGYDADDFLPRALEALEAVLDLAREWEGSSDLLNPSLRPYTRSARLRAAIESALRGEP